MDSAFRIGQPADLWKVFLLFMIPWGGGIPAGVTVGSSLGLGWATMTWLYFLSDVCLAFIFEPILRGFLHLTKNSTFWNRLRDQLKTHTQKTAMRFGTDLKPWSLVMIAFGVDPMTGRAVAMSVGHGFIAGWAIAIAGDLIFFLVIMSSTLWLSHLIGNGTWATVIIMIAMLVIPKVFTSIKIAAKAFLKFKS